MSKKSKKVILILAALSTFALAVVGGRYTYCKMHEKINIYKTQNVIDIGYEDLYGKNEQTFVLVKNEKVYLTNQSGSLLIGELHDGDSIDMLYNTTSGWAQIVYHGEKAYVKTIGIMEEEPTSFVDVNEQMYIVPEMLEIVSVNKSNETKKSVTIQTLVERVATNNNGMSKILVDGIQYYVPSDCLSHEKPVIWTEPEKEDWIIGDFNGATILSDFKDDSSIVQELKWAEPIKQISVGDNGWSKVLYNDQEAYIKTESLKEAIYPIVYEDETCKITITREWYKKAWCYTAHLEFTDYARFGTNCANGKYGNGYETTSHAAERLGAIFAVNGCYSAPYLGYTVVRDGKICNGWGRTMNLPGVYSDNTGLFSCAWSPGGASGIVGHNVSKLVESGKVTDTFCFGPPSLVNGRLQGSNGGARAQRTLMGTNGNPGDLWIVVSDGRYNDGESAGLTFYEGAQYLKELGCTFGIHLDGGGSSTMYFNGKVLNAVAGNERAVVDFAYFK